MTETAPPGLTLVLLADTCLRNDPLIGGASYPPITATVNVAAAAASPQLQAVCVSGGGSATAGATVTNTVSPRG